MSEQEQDYDERGLLSKLLSLPRPVWVLCAGMFINKFGAFVVPFLTLYMSKQGYGAGEAALALSGYGIGNLFASIAGGIMADVLGRRKTIAVSMACGSVAMGSLVLADGLWAIVGMTAFAGFASELYRPAAAALIADLVGPGERVFAFAVYRASFNAGWMFGPAVGGLIAKYSYVYLFVGEAVTCALFGIVAWRFLPAGVRGAPVGTGVAGVWQVVRRDVDLRIVLITYLLIGALFFQMASTYSKFVTGLGFSEFQYGLLIGSNGLLILLIEVPLTRWTARYPAKWVIGFGYLLVAIGTAMNAFGSSFGFLMLAMTVFSFGEIVAMPVAMAYVSGLAPASMRGRYMGAVGFAWSAALILGPAAGLWAFAKSGTTFWLYAGGAGLLAAILVRFLSPERAPGAEGAGQEKALAESGE